MINKLQNWVQEIEPFILHIQDDEQSWISLDGDLSGSQVQSGKLSEMVDILLNVFGVLAIKEPGMIIVGNNNELNEYARLNTLTQIDSSTIEPLNADNIDRFSTKSDYVSNVAFPVITLARFKNSSFTYYRGNPRFIIFDERPQIEPMKVHETIVADICDMFRQSKSTNSLVPDMKYLVDGYIRREYDDDGIEISKRCRFFRHGYELKLKNNGTYSQDLSDVHWDIEQVLLSRFRRATSNINPATDPKTRDLYDRIKGIINLVSKSTDEDFLPKLLLTIPTNATREYHQRSVQEVVSQLAELFVIVALNQPDMPEDNEEQRKFVTNIKWMFTAFPNEWLIFDDTAGVSNPNIPESFYNQRIKYPPVELVGTRSILSNVQWNTKMSGGLFGPRLSKGTTKGSYEYTENDNQSVISMSKGTYLSMMVSFRDSYRLVIDPTNNVNINHIRDYIELSIFL